MTPILSATAPAVYSAVGPADPDRLIRRVDAWLDSPPTPSDLWQAVHDYRRLGWCVFPVVGKRPACPWKAYQTRRPSLDLLSRLFERPGVTGMAVITGWISGWRADAGRPARKLAIRDFDRADAYHRWADAYPSLAAALPTVRTRRGYHVYCWSAYEVDARDLPDGGELKARTSCYALLPPSQHPDGPAYRWVIPPPSDPDRMPLIDPRAAGLYLDPPPSCKTQGTCNNRMNIYCHTGDLRVREWGVGSMAARTVPAPQSTALVSVETPDSQSTALVHPETPDPQSTALVHPESPTQLSREDWEAVWLTLPDGPGQRHRCLFDLARHLRGIPHLADAPATVYIGIVRVWWTHDLPNIKTKDWDVSWREFSDAWRRVRRPIGQDAIAEMLRAAVGTGDLPADRRAQAAEIRRRLIAVCRALQTAAEMRQADRWYLSCRTAARMCGITGRYGYRTANRWLNRLVEDGVLELVRQGIGGTKSREASEYRLRGTVAAAAA